MASPPLAGPSRRRSVLTSLQKLLRAIRNLLIRSTARPGTDNDQADLRLTGADKRRHPRVNLAETTVQVTDGCLFATALIDNISLCGICLRNLPEQLYRSARRLTVYSCDNPGIPILHIQPQWETTGWDGKTIGASILNTSETWRLFFVHTAGRLKACPPLRRSCLQVPEDVSYGHTDPKPGRAHAPAGKQGGWI